MTQIGNCVLRLRVWNHTAGQDLVEYALAAGLVAVAAVAAIPTLSATVSTVFSKIGSIVAVNVTSIARRKMRAGESPAPPRPRR